jgi:AraC-like DNA-binding protein
MAADAAVPIAALSDPDLMIASDAVGRLLERSARQAGVEAFGLRLAASRRISNLGPVGLIAREQPTLRKALDVLGQYLWLHNEALSLKVEETGDIAVLRLDIQAAGQRVSRQATELAVGVMVGILRGLLGEAWRPEAALLRHGPPADPSTHRQVLGPALQFWAEFDGLALRRVDLGQVLPSAGPAAAAQIRRFIERAAGERPRRTRDVAGELVVLLLPTGTCSADRVARHLGYDRRTLYRRLAAEGVSFSAVVDEKRRELVLSHLAAGRPVSQIADLAGLRAASGLSHWFARRFGCSPTAWSRTHFRPPAPVSR